MDAMVSMLLVLALAFVTQTVPKPAAPVAAAPDTVQAAPAAPEASPADSLGCNFTDGSDGTGP